MKAFIVRSALLLTSLYAISPTHACGPSLMTDESRFALFRNGLNGYDGLNAFYYTENFLNSNIPDPQSLDYKRNCAEWQGVVNDRKVSDVDIYQFQYLTNADSFLAAAYSNNYTPYRKNTFVAWLLQKENARFLDYFVLAKKAEATQFGNAVEDMWAYEDQQKINEHKKYIAALVQESVAMVRKSKKQILKQRYAFQAIKLAYYADVKKGDVLYNTIEQLFNKYIKGTQSVVEGWSHHFIGLMQPNNSDEKAIHLLLAFDLSEEKKLAAYRALYNSNYNLDKLSQKYPDIKIPALAIAAFSNPGRQLNAIQKIYEVDPKSKYLPFLLGREINKIENWIWSKDLINFDNINDRLIYDAADFEYKDNDYVRINQFRDWQYFNSVVQFLEKLRSAGQSDQNFIKLSLVHLYNIKEDYTSAKNILATVQVAENSKYYSQYLIERVLTIAQTEDVLLEATKVKLANDLNSLLQHHINKINSDEFDYDEESDDFGELLVYLSKVYEKKGDLVTAGLLKQKSSIAINEYGYSSWYYVENESGVNEANNYSSIAYFDKHASVDDIYRLIMLKHKKNKSSFELLLSPTKWADDDFYLDLIGTKYLRDEEYRKALDVFSKIESSFWETQYEYKNYIPQKSIFDLGDEANWEQSTLQPYPIVSKYLIVKDIVQVLDQLEQTKIGGDARANLLLKLAKAKMNMSYYGDNWMMMSYGWTYREDMNHKGGIFSYSFYPNTVLYGANYYQGYNAKQTLDLALTNAVNSELRAQIILNQLVLRSWYGGNISIPLANQLKLKQTKIFQSAVTHCPDIL